MKKANKGFIGLFIVLAILGLLAYKVYPYIIVGMDYLNDEESEMEDGKGIGETINEQVENGKIQSDPEAVNALESILEDLPKAKDMLPTEEQKEVIILAEQTIDSIINNEEDYTKKLDGLMEAYRALPSDEQQDVQISIGRNINMRDYLTLKEKIEEQ